MKTRDLVFFVAGAFVLLFIVIVGQGLEPDKVFEWETIFAGMLGVVGGSFAFIAVSRQVRAQAQMEERSRINATHGLLASMLFDMAGWMVLTNHALSMFTDSEEKIDLKLFRSVLGNKLNRFNSDFTEKISETTCLPGDIAGLLYSTFELTEIFVHTAREDEDLDEIMKPMLSIQLEAIQQSIKVLAEMRNCDTLEALIDVADQFKPSCVEMLGKLNQEMEALNNTIREEL